MGRVVLHWFESAAYGPQVEFLLDAVDMAGVRRIADEAELYWGPPDRRRDALAAKDPLRHVAAAHPDDLLWRLEGEDAWRVGARAAARWRAGDIARVNGIVAEAGQRRRRRRRG